MMIIIDRSCSGYNLLGDQLDSMPAESLIVTPCRLRILIEIIIIFSPSLHYIFDCLIFHYNNAKSYSVFSLISLGGESCMLA